MVNEPNDTPETIDERDPLLTEDALDAALNALPDNAGDESPHFTDDPLATGEFDIDAALAAVAALQDIVHEPDPEPLAPPAPPDEAGTTEARSAGIAPVDEALIGLDAEGEALDAAPAAHPVSYFARPPLLAMQRGQAASVVPAIVLMALGAWLTYSFVSGTGLPAAQLPGLLAGAAGVMLLAQWLTAERWARGSFFIGMLLVLGGGVLLLLAQPAGSGLAGAPLFITAAGVAMLLTAIFTPPYGGRLGFVGLAFGMGGAAALLFMGGFLPAEVLNPLLRLAPVILVAATVIIVLPILRR